MKTLIIIPTYNEKDNIKKLIHNLLELYPNVDILIIDDGSPDGTGEVVKNIQQADKRIKLIERESKLGLGTAYVAGYKFMLSSDYDVAIQMDADFSHNPKDIKKFRELAKDYDLIIGSRYVQGVNVINWPMKRLLLSYFANIYTKIITGLPLCDSTGGFKCFRREVLESIELDNIKSNGYAFQIEMNYKAWKHGFRLKESPIVFTDRVEGNSKMSKKIVREAIFMVWRLRFSNFLKLE